MKIRELYDAALIEINKVEAPSMLLEDFIYFINKAIQQYINKAYNKYEMTQQATDDLRALKTTAVLDVLTSDPVFPKETNLHYCKMPENYMHLLNCIVGFDKIGNDDLFKCPGKNMEDADHTALARKLTSDIYPSIINNAYFKPSYQRPYYNITTYGLNDPQPKDLRLEIKCGDTKKYKPSKVFIDYIRTPKQIKLTYEDLESEEDNTDIMEFSDYVCYEIINEFVKLALENASDTRLQTNYAINQTTGFSGLKE